MGDQTESGTTGLEGNRGKWWLIAWAVLTVGMVAVLLPRGQDRREPRKERADTPAIAPVSASTLIDRGNLAMRERTTDPTALDRALGHFEQAHQQDPDHPGASFGLAWAMQVKGLPESQWRELYQETAARSSTLAYLSLYNLAYAEQAAGKYPEAAAFIEHGLRVMPERADGWIMSGEIHLTTGEHARALADLRKAIELDGNSSRAFYLLGQAQRQLGQDGEAEASWSRALQINPAMEDQIEAARAR